MSEEKSIDIDAKNIFNTYKSKGRKIAIDEFYLLVKNKKLVRWESIALSDKVAKLLKNSL